MLRNPVLRDEVNRERMSVYDHLRLGNVNETGC